MHKRTTVDQIQISREGLVALKLVLEIVEGENVLVRNYHRVELRADASIGSALDDANLGLSQGEAAWPPLTEIDRQRVAAVAMAAVDLRVVP